MKVETMLYFEDIRSREKFTVRKPMVNMMFPQGSPSPFPSPFNYDGLYLTNDSNDPLNSTLGIGYSGLVDGDLATPIITPEYYNWSIGIDLGVSQSMKAISLIDDGTAGTGLGFFNVLNLIIPEDGLYNGTVDTAPPDLTGYVLNSEPKLVDRDFTTVVGPYFEVGKSWGVDLGYVDTVDYFLFYDQHDDVSGYFSFGKFIILVSNDNNNWTQVGAELDSVDLIRDVNKKTTKMSPKKIASGRYWRIYCSQTAAIDASALYPTELEVYRPNYSGLSPAPSPSPSPKYTFDELQLYSSGDNLNWELVQNFSAISRVPYTNNTYKITVTLLSPVNKRYFKLYASNGPLRSISGGLLVFTEIIPWITQTQGIVNRNVYTDYVKLVPLRSNIVSPLPSPISPSPETSEDEEIPIQQRTFA